MEKHIGLWIDHKKAVIVTLKGKSEELQTIESNMEKHVRYKGGSRGKTAYSPQFLSAETQEDRRYREHLNKYYQQVISIIGDVDSLLVFGAGEAKHEFEKRLAHKGNQVKHIHVEAADKMTERQIAARVRKYFEK
ncbi:MAG: hypothetical protein JNM02_05025 [Anaerolineales bacterium]|nr:hypothetical protein [Anaerolineales bacterium]